MAIDIKEQTSQKFVVLKHILQSQKKIAIIEEQKKISIKIKKLLENKEHEKL